MSHMFFRLVVMRIRIRYGVTMETKKEIRKQILQKRDALFDLERQQKSEEIVQKVIASEVFQNSDVFLLFSSYKSEVDVTKLIEYTLLLGKKVYLPKVIGLKMEFYRIFSMSELEDGYCGIKEPKVEPSRIFQPKKGEQIFVLLPGIAFDKEGGRIGYGKGFYDRFLEKLEIIIPQANISKVAVAFCCQIVDNGRIKKENHDILPDYIITEDVILSIFNHKNAKKRKGEYEYDKSKDSI